MTWNEMKQIIFTQWQSLMKQPHDENDVQFKRILYAIQRSWHIVMNHIYNGEE